MAPGPARADRVCCHSVVYPRRSVDCRYPRLLFDLERDAFVVWVRWVSLEDPPSPHDPPHQGIRVELMLNRNSVLGPTIIYRRDLEQAAVYLRANRTRVTTVLRRAEERQNLDIQLVIHGSIANAPYAALHLVRDYEGEAIDIRGVSATPLLQVQSSTPGEQWHCAGQSNLRVHLELEGTPRHLQVIR